MVRELVGRLEGIKDRLVRCQDGNLKVWSQTQLWPERGEGWLALDQDLRRICGLVEEYYFHIDEYWASRGVAGRRPVLLRDPVLLQAFQELARYCSQVSVPASGAEADRGRSLAVQRHAWSLLEGFPAAHEGFLAQLDSQEPVVAPGLVVVE